MNKAWPEYEQTTKGQFQAAMPDHSAWVSANAGSGKTKVLIDRVARLLLRNVKPDAILCVTYTKAAASEMQARLFKRLGSWCVANNDGLRKELAELEGRAAQDYTEDDLGRARELFALALETPGGLRIETIHAFCGRLLRRFPLEAGAPPGFRELDDADSGRLWSDALARLGTAVDKQDSDPMLVAAISEAALAVGGNGLSGPLQALLTQRAAVEHFIAQQGGLPGALAYLKAQIDAPDDDVDTLIAHAMGPALPGDQLRSLIAPLQAGKKSDIATADAIVVALSDAPAETRLKAYRSVAFTGSGDLRKSNPYTAGPAKALPQLVDLFQCKEIPEGSEISRLRHLDDQLKARRVYERSAALLTLAQLVFQDYANAKRRRAALDFDDLINAAVALLSNTTAAQWVLWKLDGGLTHILLDEAQDTSPEQWSLMTRLTEEFFSGDGVAREEERTMFVVGDEKQSIYSFQGADPERFLHERSSFDLRAKGSGRPFVFPSMQMSFRSAPEILSFVDTTFDTDAFDGDAPFSIAPPAEGDVIRHLAFRRKHAGLVELWPMTAPDVPEESTPWDAPRGQQSEASPKAQLAKRIARWANELITRGDLIWEDGVQRPARPGDILILVRGRKGGLFDAIIKALKHEGLPVAGADRIDLFDSLPVQDLLNLIRFTLCPEDDLTLAEILTGPFGGLNEDAHLFPLAWKRNGSLWAAMQDSADEQVHAVREFLETVLDRRHWPAFEFLTAALEWPHADGLTGWDKVQARMGAPVREPLIALLDRADGFDARDASSLQLFLSTIETEGGDVKRELSGPQDEVRVMTVHGSKGLEAPIVVVPDTCAAPRTGSDDGLLVSRRDDMRIADEGAPFWVGSKGGDTSLTTKLRNAAAARDLREHRRLLYVALTRAEDRLLVCGPWTGGTRTETGYKEKSWFDVCQSAMMKLVEDGAARQIDTEYGPVFRYGPEPETGPASRPSMRQMPSGPDWLRQAARRETPDTRYAAPSQLISREAPVLAPFGADRSRRLARGRLIHTLLQTLPAAPADDWDRLAERYLAPIPDFDDAEKVEMTQAALGVLKDRSFAEVFAPGSRAEVPIVGGNEARLPKGMRINGRVDRLIVREHDVLIVDFKSDRPAPARAEDVGETYIAQLAAYRAVLESAYRDKLIRCALVWTDGPKLMELPAPALDRALQDIREQALS